MTEVTQYNPMQKQEIRAPETSTNCLSVEKWLRRTHARSSNFLVNKNVRALIGDNKIFKNDI